MCIYTYIHIHIYNRIHPGRLGALRQPVRGARLRTEIEHTGGDEPGVARGVGSAEFTNSGAVRIDESLQYGLTKG